MNWTNKNKVLLCVGLFLTVYCFQLTAAKTNYLPKAFIENKGQILNQHHKANNDVLFMYTGNGIKIQLRRSGYSYELFNVNNLLPLALGKVTQSPDLLSNVSILSHRIDIDFMNSNFDPEIIKEEKQQLVLNYYVDGKEVSGVASFSRITYKNIYNNIDIEFVLNKEGLLKYNIILNPGSDINKVKFLCKGASSILRKDEGSIIFSTSMGDIEENIPFSYYTATPSQNNKVNFKIDNGIISFSANYDNRKTLVIDPSTNRIWGTYFGGGSIEYCTSNGVDGANNVYIAGYSLSASNIATSGVYQSTITGSFDAYLSKFNSNGVQLWGTYFGGTSFDVFYAIHVMPSGIVFATGDTGSTTNVASVGAHQTTYGGGVDDAILVKFDANGQRLWSTYMGGTLHDISSAVTIDTNGDVIITGHTESSTAIATGGAYATAYGLNYDVFISKFNTNGVRQWGTYYGDTGADEAYGITSDASNNIYITGFTNSLFGIATGSGFQTVIGGMTDAFISKFDPAGTNLIWGTYYGGGGDEKGTAIKADPVSGNIYVGANTTSSNNIATVGAYQSSIASADDAFIVAFTSTGSRLWGTYYGGNNVDYIASLILDADKNIFVSGQTLSTNAMSSAGAYQANLGAVNFYDAYFAKFGNNGMRKEGTYFGGPDNENANGISIDSNNKVYISGETSSTVSISTPGSHMPGYAGSSDAYLAKFCIAPEPTVTPTGTFTTCVNNTYTFIASPGYSVYLWNTGSSSNPLAVNVGSVAGTFYYAIAVTDADGCDGTSDSSIVIVNLCTGLDESKDVNSLSIFPNPVKDVINLKWENSSLSNNVIEMYSVLGKKVLRAETSELFYKLNVEHLASGIYFLHCRLNETNILKKIVIE
jgi:hypothetical protein